MAKIHKWTTKDGREIPIRELEDNHLLHIMRFLKRQAQLIATVDALAMMRYAENAPEGAAMYAENGAEALLGSEFEVQEYFPIYKHLEKEARKRKLDLLKERVL